MSYEYGLEEQEPDAWVKKVQNYSGLTVHLSIEPLSKTNSTKAVHIEIKRADGKPKAETEGNSFEEKAGKIAFILNKNGDYALIPTDQIEADPSKGRIVLALTPTRKTQNETLKTPEQILSSVAKTFKDMGVQLDTESAAAIAFAGMRGAGRR